MLLSVDEQLKAAEIAERLKRSDQCVRETLHAYEAEGVSCLQTKSRACHSQRVTFDETGRAWLQEVVKQSPGNLGFEQSLWTLEALAQLAYELGYAERVVCPETLGRALNKRGSVGNVPSTGSTAPMRTLQRKKRGGWLKALP